MYSGYGYGSGTMIGLILVLVAMGISMLCQARIKSAYAKWRKVRNSRGITGAQVAREILDANNMQDVPVMMVDGELSDHYDPTSRTVSLSKDIYNGASIAAVAVAAHECGHAIQHETHYAPLSIRSALVPVCNIGSSAGYVAVMIGLIFGLTSIAWVGFILELSILAFQLVTLPVEFDASRRGLAILRANYLSTDEYPGARSMLTAAALTYVASMFVTLMSMIRLFLIIAGRSRRD